MALQPIPSLHVHDRPLPPIAFAIGLLACAGAQAQQPPSMHQPVAATVEQITAEANARSAAGMPAAEVETWIEQAMRAAGLSVREPPESWDVYGQARWDRESAMDAQADVSGDTQMQAAPQHDDALDDYNVYQQPGLGTPHAAGPEHGVRDAGATETGKPPLQGPRSHD